MADAQALAKPKHILKINTKTSSFPSLTSATPPPSSSKSSTAVKIKFTTKASVPPTPAASQTPPKPKKTKAGRATKPSAKVLESRKRKDDSDDEDAGSTIDVQPPAAKRVKLVSKTNATAAPKTPITPALIIKPKGKPPKRPLGEGYDSEASDRELDPTIEEEFIIRMPPGPDCEFVRQMINEKRIGGTNERQLFQLRFYDGDGRSAAVLVRNNIYAATMVDLPCIIEGMKSWDKRGQWKSADVSQMLLVHTQVRSEEEAKRTPPPREVDTTTHQYPHGLTPPMHYVRRRRFRKRLHKTQIEAVEKELDRLLAQDADADSTSYQIFDPDAEGRSEMGTPRGQTEEYSGEDDAEGEEDDDNGYFNGNHVANQEETAVDMDMDAFAAEMEAEMEAARVGLSDDVESATPVSNSVATPRANGEALTAEEEDSGDDSFEEDDMEDGQDQPDEIDEEEKTRLAQIEAAREEIAHLKEKLEDAHRSLATTTNPILKNRVTENIRKLKQELQLKMSSIGEDEDNE